MYLFFSKADGNYIRSVFLPRTIYKYPEREEAWKLHSTTLLPCLPPNWNPKMSAGSLLDALDIVFTVVTIGLVVIKGTSVVPRKRNIHVFNVLVAFWALGLIALKMLNFCYQRTGLPEKMFSPTAIHLIEIVLTLTVLGILLFLDEIEKKKKERRDRASLQGAYMQDHSFCTSYIYILYDYE